MLQLWEKGLDRQRNSELCIKSAQNASQFVNADFLKQADAELEAIHQVNGNGSSAPVEWILEAIAVLCNKNECGCEEFIL